VGGERSRGVAEQDGLGSVLVTRGAVLLVRPLSQRHQDRWRISELALFGSVLYADSHLVDFGFAHNTPLDKCKFKTGLDVAADGDIPTGYAPGLGALPAFGVATVQTNMERLRRLLEQRGWATNQTDSLYHNCPPMANPAPPHLCYAEM
jgi:hypothetical protein